MNLQPSHSMPALAGTGSKPGPAGLADEAQGTPVLLDGEHCLRISNSHVMPEFFMSMASAGNHWMFISSRGAISAGRGNADQALFPYLPADRLIDCRHVTGPCTLIRVADGAGAGVLWQPFASTLEPSGAISQAVYKSSFGNRIWLEERHEELGLLFRQSWSFGNRFGFVRGCELVNLRAKPVHLRLLDGLQNIVPAGLTAEFQLRFSNLADAYRRNELLLPSRIGLFCLGSIPTDHAVPNEALRATAVWQTGLGDAATLLHTGQIAQFVLGHPVRDESEIRGRRGAYLTCQSLVLRPAGEAALPGSEQPGLRWSIVANTGCDQAAVAELDLLLGETQEVVAAELQADIADNNRQLLGLLSAADGRQTGRDRLRTQRHQNNVLFNIMRGGLPVDDYQVHREAFLEHLRHFNRPVFARQRQLLEELPLPMARPELLQRLEAAGDPDLLRLGEEFLPFGFSRRHGDPTRPWNQFNIDVGPSGERLSVHYEGNWRDIFQNWEALAMSWPEFLPAMVLRFVNASTADGYNPYRLSQDGFEWEEPDPSGPWSNIGYWGDHQIVYLLRLLELAERFDPEGFQASLACESCVFAEIPYRIVAAADIRRNPRATIEYDYAQAEAIDLRVRELGADGRLLLNAQGTFRRADLLEKLLLPALVKLTNLVPGGGIWLNTQRPEWNDANNALAGYGLSVVTVCHLHRYLVFLRRVLGSASQATWLLSGEITSLMEAVRAALAAAEADGDAFTDGRQRRQTVDALLLAGERYRDQLRSGGPDSGRQDVPLSGLCKFLDQAIRSAAMTIRRNQRPDGMYHAYNLLDYCPSGVSDEVRHLDLMLEGQVAVLSAEILTVEQVSKLLDGLAASPLVRPDQASFLLYPDRALPRFMAKNVIPPGAVTRSRLLARLRELNDQSLIVRDARGNCRFQADIRNTAGLDKVLGHLLLDDRFTSLVEEETGLVREIHEAVFCHREFTGRSGSFFGYEGLGSIYWHMVSKLHLAIQENLLGFRDSAAATPALENIRHHYEQVGAGLGLHKRPADYGAFTTDPYSHTPQHAGAQQPGMTGQVKEDILVRLAELGVRVNGGAVSFDPWLFRNEFLVAPATLDFVDGEGELRSLPVSAGSFAFTFCRVPVIYRAGDRPAIRIRFRDGETRCRAGTTLTVAESRLLFGRTGQIELLEVEIAWVIG